ncbi:thiol reductant ABC exporter subunit CydC [Saccharibacter floricola]|uniref:thiol reductant ABC exporter subunit CydC n=1 Tax=Saccharibacter floricola TaxID=231053 RepID=UPI0003676EE6|nr:thiol reductant ABC exporter subunit CydC [Saccharibacter floricola]
MTQPSPSAFSIRPFLRQARGVLFAGCVLSCLASLASFGLLFLSGWLLAGAAAAGIGGIVAQNMFNITLPAAGVRFFATVRIVARYGERLITHDAALRVTGKLRVWSFKTLAPRSESLATQARSGDVLSRFVHDTEQLGQFPLDVGLPVGTALVGALVAVGVTSLFNPASGLVLAIGLSVGGLALPWLIGVLTDPLSQKQRENTARLHADMLETLQGMADILANGAAQRCMGRLHQRQTTVNRLILGQAWRSHIVRQLLPILTMLCVLGVLFCASEALQAGHLTTAQLPMLAMGVLAAFEMIAPLMEARLAYERFVQAAQRAGALCALPIATPEPSTPVALPQHAPLALRHVQLSLGGHKVLNDVTFSLAPGERCAITGPSGAGKSTISRLIMRLIDPDHGSVTLGDKPLNHFTTEQLSHEIGMLSQTPHLFQGSVRRNLLMADPQATEAQMIAALHIVDLHEEVNAMPQGLDTLCGEHGTRLSGGQMRRLALAQIVLRRPSFLVLDEPTESLPPSMGTHIIDNVLAALPQAGVLCITHRPEPLPFMNRVFRLHNGALIAEEGGER